MGTIMPAAKAMKSREVLAKDKSPFRYLTTTRSYVAYSHIKVVST